MEISAQVLREVEFSGSLRGYNTDEVDEFLEQVAVAVDRLQSQSRLAAEQAASERAERERAGTEDEESIRRTLVLAQRTADLAIKEAQEEAGLLIDKARAEAEALLSEAQTGADRLASESVEQLRDEVERLTSLCESLKAEADSLVSLLAAERGRLTESLSTALRYVERTLTPSAAVISAGTAPTSFSAAGGEGTAEDTVSDGSVSDGSASDGSADDGVSGRDSFSGAGDGSGGVGDGAEEAGAGMDRDAGYLAGGSAADRAYDLTSRRTEPSFQTQS